MSIFFDSNTIFGNFKLSTIAKLQDSQLQSVLDLQKIIQYCVILRFGEMFEENVDVAYFQTLVLIS